MNTFATTLLAAMDKGFENTPVEDQQTIPLALMQKWLMDVGKVDLVALPYTNITDSGNGSSMEKKWIWMIYQISSSTATFDSTKKLLFNSYEEALLAGIAEALTLLP